MITTKLSKKEEKVAYDKTYVKANKEKRLATTRAWKQAHPESGKDYYENNKEHVNAKSKLWYEANKDRVKHLNLQRDFGITLDDYNKLLNKQNECCCICHKHQSEFKIKLAVDHNHETGEVRGLLCTNCNNGLGRFKDNKDLLSEAIKYLTS